MWETKGLVFPIPCEMQRGVDFLHPDYPKERENDQGHSFGILCDSAKRK